MISSMKKKAKMAGTLKQTVKAFYKDPTMDSSIRMKEDAVKDALAKRAAFLGEAFEFMGDYRRDWLAAPLTLVVVVDIDAGGAINISELQTMCSVIGATLLLPSLSRQSPLLTWLYQSCFACQ